MRTVWLAVAASAALHGGLLAWPAVAPADGAGPRLAGTKLEARLLTAQPSPDARLTQRAFEAAGLAQTPAPPPEAVGHTDSRMANRQADVRAPDYWPANQLERAPVPVSAPDSGLLQGVELPAGSLRLELFIDRSGQVRTVRPADARENAEGIPRAITEMFLATRFLPGLRAGAEVPSRIVIEVSIQDLLRMS
ncbi:hypothetical protein ACFONG_15330 [Uliginosibacterium paludis]|uniref:TonB C-terminal domain-containing protein n=1 Tax=Uliginosibacterium paludis TaxID=1615952 RepID=A0ABV2CTI7_9RHOO